MAMRRHRQKLEVLGDGNPAEWHVVNVPPMFPQLSLRVPTSPVLRFWLSHAGGEYMAEPPSRCSSDCIRKWLLGPKPFGIDLI